MSLPQHLAQPKYRPDIDGLRAVAVLSVVLFHAFPSLVRGGFIGVDVFFVISGYLICTIIFESLARGTFSFGEFYGRRVKRIFPALWLVLVASAVMGWYVLIAQDYQQLGKHIVAGAGFVSNFVLWGEAGYFDAAAETKPLLHLWSLGIEEQFYIVWPLLLWLAWRCKVNLVVVTLVVAGASFYLNIAGLGGLGFDSWLGLGHADGAGNGAINSATPSAQQAAVATFYSPLTRFWELLCGSLLAWVTLQRQGVFNAAGAVQAHALQTNAPNTSVRYADASSIIGVLLLAYGFWLIDKDAHFPGYWALVPVLGAALIIHAGPQAWVNRVLLSNRVMVWFGLISFPLYLWHWPLLTFARIAEGDVPSVAVRSAAVSVSVLLAWLTYRFIERPIRHGKVGQHGDAHRKTKVYILTALMAAVAYVGYYIYAQEGLPTRFPKMVQELIYYKYDHKAAYRHRTCFLEERQDHTAFTECKSETNTAAPIVLLWGDSHAAHLYPGYKTVYGQAYNIMQRTAQACPPLLNVEAKGNIHCKDVNEDVLNTISALMKAHNASPQNTAQPISKVVLAANWAEYGAVLQNASQPSSALQATITQLKSMGVPTVDVIGPVPLWKDSLPKQLFNYFKRNPQQPIPQRMNNGLDTRFIPLDTALRQQATQAGARYQSPKAIMCDANGCLTRLGDTGDTLTAWDYGHLTTKGAEYLVGQFER